jgi:hypothetical protein
LGATPHGERERSSAITILKNLVNVWRLVPIRGAKEQTEAIMSSDFRYKYRYTDPLADELAGRLAYADKIAVNEPTFAERLRARAWEWFKGEVEKENAAKNAKYKTAR